MIINLPENTTRKKAIAAVREYRKSSPGAKLYVHQGVATQPGKGLVAFVNYFIKASI